ncbi:MAG: hypothetical protein OEO84_02695 [Betaproteobacteria bacterium]|nr:hypothetical protein [Betaproteobacteria bacterium]
MASDGSMAQQAQASRVALWLAIALAAALLGFMIGYAMSARTGVEPGYFEAPEAGGYGVSPGSKSKTGAELQKYYENLLK